LPSGTPGQSRDGLITFSLQNEEEGRSPSGSLAQDPEFATFLEMPPRRHRTVTPAGYLYSSPDNPPKVQCTMPQGAIDRTGREVDHLRNLALRMGGLSERILDKSLSVLWERNTQLAAEVMADDLEIDRIDVEIDSAVLSVLALRAPVASDLRETLAIKTMATDLERVGDLARNIAGSAIRVVERSTQTPPADLRELAEDSRRSLARALQAFADRDVVLARSILTDDESIDQAEGQVIRKAISRIHEEPGFARHEIDLIFIAKNLERVADHATNIAEEVILAAESLNLKHAGKLAI
jgi:phosphate transport system protein